MPTQIKEVATVRITRAELSALINVANAVLVDGEAGYDEDTIERATRALTRAVECFGGKWSMNAGAVGHNL